ncbi:diguanylate cyclase (GGDEF)-like protein [Actinoplanes campanulatus]|uniref:Diguanylate cyclase (GGDEF)-like protein n=1 Tax=Actinoplanes campanulatus TaxID=113559 RepID=A0A7W5ACW1_9ACTN|nr:GGDEF domain-containing protein [Actinoplanes campanulatus]MBB3093742.1 diguanylate cyclase (GGDEF)-like protein [Actinoplanes campanulatus]
MRRELWAGLTWTGVMVLCVALRVTLGATDTSYLVTIAPYMLVSAGTPIAVLVGTLRHRPPHRAGWFLLAAAQAVYAVADGMTVRDDWLGSFLEPTPADLVYFASYLLLSAAVLVFIRRRTPGWDIPSGIDALVVSISAGLLTWIYVLQPLTSDSALPLNAKLTQSAYPVLDLMVLILAVRLVMGTGTRGPVLWLLLSSLTLMFSVDTAYAVEGIADGGAVDEAYLDAMWMISLGLLGTAALHPGIRRFDQRSDTALPDASPARLGVLAVAVLMAPGVQFIQWLRGEPVSVPLISAACAVMFLLVLARMYGLVTAQRRAAVTDSLTGLHTRRHFTQALAVECRRATRAGHGVGLLIIDVDHFKKVNDGYGHPAGDQVLREVARRLAAGSRAGGVIARYGGEEFVVLAPHTGPGELYALAERLREEMAGLPVDIGGDLLSVTVSIGAAVAVGPDPEALLHDADEALYAAKAAGRNRAILSPAG